MSIEKIKSTAQISQPAANPFDALVDSFRQVVREEIAAALDSKGEKPPTLLYSTGEAAEILSVPETWLAAQARAGKIQTVRLGHYVRFRPSELEEFLEKQNGHGSNN